MSQELPRESQEKGPQVVAGKKGPFVPRGKGNLPFLKAYQVPRNKIFNFKLFYYPRDRLFPMSCAIPMVHNVM